MVRSDSAIAYGLAVAGLLREARRRQGLTQAQLAGRTRGAVSKAALANYESGHRSLRIDVFWSLIRALGEDAGAILANAGRRNGGTGPADASGPLVVDVATVSASTDARLAPVRRWFALRTADAERRALTRTITLDGAALSALAALMDVEPAEVRLALLDAARTQSDRPVRCADSAAPGSAPGANTTSAGAAPQ